MSNTSYWAAFTDYIYVNRHRIKARIGKFSNFSGKAASLVGFGWTYLGIASYFGFGYSNLLDWLYACLALLVAGLTSWGMYYGVKIATDNYTQYSETNNTIRKSAFTLFLIICSIALTAFAVFIQTYTNIPLLGPFVNSHIPTLDMQFIAMGFATIFTLSIAAGAINQGHRYWINRKPMEEDDCCKSPAYYLNVLGNLLNMGMSIVHICFVIPSGIGLGLGIVYALSDWVIHQLNSSILFGTKENPRPELANIYFGLVIMINLISRIGLGISVYGGVFLLCSAISSAFPPLLVLGVALFFATIAGTSGFLYSYNQAYTKWCQLKGKPFENTQQANNDTLTDTPSVTTAEKQPTSSHVSIVLRFQRVVDNYINELSCLNLHGRKRALELKQDIQDASIIGRSEVQQVLSNFMKTGETHIDRGSLLSGPSKKLNAMITQEFKQYMSTHNHSVVTLFSPVTQRSLAPTMQSLPSLTR